MRNIRIASPLFLLREEAGKALFPVLDGIAALGFDGVEMLGLFDQPAAAIRKRLDALSLKAMGNHVPLKELTENAAQTLDDNLTLGCEYITISGFARELASADGAFDSLLAEVGEACERIRAAGMTPLYHNHDYDIADPLFIPQLFAANEKHGLCFEPDLGWIRFCDRDPADYLRKYAHCSPVLHFKDIYAEDFSLLGDGKALSPLEQDAERGGFAFRPTGYGIMNYPALMPLCLACNPAWIVTDHDSAYTRSAYDDLGLSLQYTKALLALHKEA